MFDLPNTELESAVKNLRNLAEQRSAVLSHGRDYEVRDTFYDNIAVFAEEVLKEIKSNKKRIW